MAIYKTERGRDDVWEEDTDLVIEIRNDGDVVPASWSGAPSNYTSVEWSGPDGDGGIIFFDDGRVFTGWCRRSDEKEPKSYRGKLLSGGWYI